MDKEIIITESNWKKRSWDEKKRVGNRRYVLVKGEWFLVKIDISRQTRGYIPTPCNMEHLF